MTNETKEEVFCYWLGYQLRRLFDAFKFFGATLLLVVVVLVIAFLVFGENSDVARFLQ